LHFLSSTIKIYLRCGLEDNSSSPFFLRLLFSAKHFFGPSQLSGNIFLQTFQIRYFRLPIGLCRLNIAIGRGYSIPEPAPKKTWLYRAATSAAASACASTHTHWPCSISSWHNQTPPFF
jgi:hypothetical protein